MALEDALLLLDGLTEVELEEDGLCSEDLDPSSEDSSSEESLLEAWDEEAAEDWAELSEERTS